MRFTFISTMGGHPWGGSEELWSQAALRLARMSHKVTASVQYSDELHAVLRSLEKAGVVVAMRQRDPLLWQRGLARLFRIPWGGVDIQIRKRWLSRLDTSLVCISQGGAADGLAWMLGCLEARVPYVTIAHLVSPWAWPDDKTAQQLLKAYQGAKRCFFVSQRCRQMFQNQIGEELVNAQIVRNPFKVPYDARLGWPPRDAGWRLACVARLDPAFKGQDLLLQVLAGEKWKQRPLKIMIYGSGPFENTLKRLRDRLGVETVEFKGHAEDILQIWRENHALILPSRWENMPLALVEAMLCSRMSVVTDVGGTTELIEHGVNGFVAAAPTVDFLDAVLEEAWRRREDWPAMGVEGRRRAVSLVPADPVGDFCEQLLELAASEPSQNWEAQKPCAHPEA